MIKQAFQAICTEATKANHRYVSLYKEIPFYGGPEEGGWWGTDRVLVETQRFATEDDAESVVIAVRELAQKLTEDARRADSEAMARSVDWLEERRLDADFLPEPDGPEKYFVVVEEHPGSSEKQGERHY